MRSLRGAPCHLLLVALLVLFAGPGTARADNVDDALLMLSADSFEKIQKGIEDLTRSGSPVAEPVLSALANGRLFIQSADRTIVYRDDAGTLHLARTGSPANIDPAAFKPVRLNNRLRRVVMRPWARLRSSRPIRCNGSGPRRRSSNPAKPPHCRRRDRSVPRDRHDGAA